MTKIKSRLFKGIEFIQLRDLPANQKNNFLEWLDKDNIINIQVGSKVEKDCVQYSDYCYWFEQQENNTESIAKHNGKTSPEKSIGLAFD
ncbi:MAG: hypothetical protein OEW75_12615 [Cyclobacteriaceae bacterium]|nr:hypothetical protein [Cyclobacteriaceae bacterium]